MLTIARCPTAGCSVRRIPPRPERIARRWATNEHQVKSLNLDARGGDKGATGSHCELRSFSHAHRTRAQKSPPAELSAARRNALPHQGGGQLVVRRQAGESRCVGADRIQFPHAQSRRSELVYAPE